MKKRKKMPEDKSGKLKTANKKRLRATSRFFVFILLFVFPLSLNAGLLITEIMYDLEIGSDGGREWIEVTNTGSGDIDLNEYSFLDNNGESNHPLSNKLQQGSDVLKPGESAIVADNYLKFLEDWPSFSGNLLDSSFSLNNTGEGLLLKNSEGLEMDSITYSSEMGANGDGNSLHRNTDSLNAASQNPGTYNGEIDYSNSNNNESGDANNENSNSSSSSNTSSTNSPLPAKKTISIEVPKDSAVLSGADINLEARVYGLEGVLMENARITWNFGDGALKEGGNILHNFRYPGKYIVFVDGSSGGFSATGRFVVTALAPKIVISDLDKTEGKFIKIRNNSEREIDLSFWRLRAGDKYFSIPKNTHLLPESEVTFPSLYTGLDARSFPVEILYPNGDKLPDGKEDLPDNAKPSQKTASSAAREGSAQGISAPQGKQVSVSETLEGGEETFFDVSASGVIGAALAARDRDTDKEKGNDAGASILEENSENQKRNSSANWYAVFILLVVATSFFVWLMRNERFVKWLEEKYGGRKTEKEEYLEKVGEEADRYELLD